MDFGIALIALENGQAVYRKCWSHDYGFITKVEDHVGAALIRHNAEDSNCYWTPSYNDLFCKDWEIKND